MATVCVERKCEICGSPIMCCCCGLFVVTQPNGLCRFCAWFVVPWLPKGVRTNTVKVLSSYGFST